MGKRWRTTGSARLWRTAAATSGLEASLRWARRTARVKGQAQGRADRLMVLPRGIVIRHLAGNLGQPTTCSGDGRALVAQRGERRVKLPELRRRDRFPLDGGLQIR